MPETTNIEYKTEWKDDFLKVICAFSVTFFTKVFKDEPNHEHDEPVNGYNESVNEPENRIQRLLTILKNERTISAELLASLLFVSLSTIKRDLKMLKEKGQIKRTGSAKGGFWEVNHE